MSRSAEFETGRGQLRTLYHATGYSRPEEIEEAGALRASANGESGPGVYLSADRAYAEKLSSGKPNAATFEVQALVRNPLVRHTDVDDDPGDRAYRALQQSTDGWYSKPGAAQKALTEAGYDAVESHHPWGHELALHDPAQIRSMRRL